MNIGLRLIEFARRGDMESGVYIATLYDLHGLVADAAMYHTERNLCTPVLMDKALYLLRHRIRLANMRTHKLQQQIGKLNQDIRFMAAGRESMKLRTRLAKLAGKVKCLDVVCELISSLIEAAETHERERHDFYTVEGGCYKPGETPAQTVRVYYHSLN